MFDRDFDELAVGDRFLTGGRTVTEADVVSFACLTGDMHPQHTDRAWAASSLFGERVAHGMLVASFALGMLPFVAEVVLTGFGRARSLTERAARQLPEACDVLELDVNSDSDLSALRAELAGRWQGVDGVLHAIAYAPEDAIGGRFLDTPASSAVTA